MRSSGTSPNCASMLWAIWAISSRRSRSKSSVQKCSPVEANACKRLAWASQVSSMGAPSVRGGEVFLHVNPAQAVHLACALQHVHPCSGDLLAIVVQHWPWLAPDALDVRRVGGVDDGFDGGDIVNGGEANKGWHRSGPPEITCGEGACPPLGCEAALNQPRSLSERPQLLFWGCFATQRGTSPLTTVVFYIAGLFAAINAAAG